VDSARHFAFQEKVAQRILQAPYGSHAPEHREQSLVAEEAENLVLLHLDQLLFDHALEKS
jgi:hypothetical protein